MPRVDRDHTEYGSWSDAERREYLESGCPCNMARYNSLPRAARKGICGMCMFGPPISIGSQEDRDFRAIERIAGRTNAREAARGELLGKVWDGDTPWSERGAILRSAERAEMGAKLLRDATTLENTSSAYAMGQDLRNQAKLERIRRDAVLDKVLRKRFSHAADLEQEKLIKLEGVRAEAVDRLQGLEKAARAVGRIGPELEESIAEARRNIEHTDIASSRAAEREVAFTDAVAGEDTPMHVGKARRKWRAIEHKRLRGEQRAIRAAEESLAADRARRYGTRFKPRYARVYVPFSQGPPNPLIRRR